MSAPIEHQSIYPNGHDDWRPGHTCDECDLRKMGVAASFPEAGKENGLIVLIRPEKVDKFYATGDPSIFAKPGAPDYDPRNQ